MTQTLGGKPNPGTKPDKRLKGNKRKRFRIADSTKDYAATETIETPTEPGGKMIGPFRTFTDQLIALEGVETGDGREFAFESIEWGEGWMPLMWQRESNERHLQSVVVGRIDEANRVDRGDGTSEIRASGVIDIGSPEGQEVARQLDSEVAGGISVDVDSVKDADVELIFDETAGAAAKGDPIALFGPPPEKVVFHRGRLRGATLVALPAFIEARITLDPDVTIDAPDLQPANLTAAGPPPLAPPRAWFEDPKLAEPTAWTVTEEGRVFGHLALKGTCHTTFADRCITPPLERDYPYFHLGELETSDGSVVAVGHVTFGTGHATISLDAGPAATHYDHTGHVGADVCVGVDRHGIWVAGALRDTVSETERRVLRSASLSGDWRRVAGKLHLVAVLAVNVPGFPVPRTQLRFTNDDTVALVASGVATRQAIEMLAEPEATLKVRKHGMR